MAKSVCLPLPHIFNQMCDSETGSNTGVGRAGLVGHHFSHPGTSARAYIKIQSLLGYELGWSR